MTFRSNCLGSWFFFNVTDDNTPSNVTKTCSAAAHRCVFEVGLVRYQCGQSSMNSNSVRPATQRKQGHGSTWHNTTWAAAAQETRRNTWDTDGKTRTHAHAATERRRTRKHGGKRETDDRQQAREVGREKELLLLLLRL